MFTESTAAPVANARATELRRLAEENGGILQPEVVVEAARPKSSPLHSWFEWNNGRAAEAYRLWQARQLIRTTVIYLAEDKSAKSVRAFISLSPDREEDGGGYREVVAVMRNRDFRAQLLADAFADLDRMREKYARLTELAEVFAAAKRAKAKVKGWRK